MATFGSVLDAIGGTPLVALERLHPGPGRLWAKCEQLNPGGSVKDRAALAVVRDARADGRLPDGRPVVEMTSGNMGAGLALVCNVYGHPFTAVLSAGNSPARVRMLEALGARVERVPQVDGVPGEVTGADVEAAARRAEALAREHDAFYVDQFDNPSCVEAHVRTTGPEIWQALDGRLDAYVAAVGGGGTFVGAARYLKRRRADVRCYGVEPASAPALAGGRVRDPRHRLQGIGYGLVPPHWDAALADGVEPVTDGDAETMRRRLATEEGLHVGYSAAANVHAARRLMTSGALGPAPVVVTILCDTGLKY